MKFVNLKTCDGLESYLVLADGLLPLKMLPERLRRMSQRELIGTLDTLKDRGTLQAEAKRKCSGWKPL